MFGSLSGHPVVVDVNLDIVVSRRSVVYDHVYVHVHDPETCSRKQATL